MFDEAKKALKRLQEGNQRFARESSRLNQKKSLEESFEVNRRFSLSGEQTPFAVILGCADSRVPVEMVFDQEIGDLFVVRVAGNIVAPSLVESVEFAAERFGSRLVVVLGHTRCGAVSATFEALLQDAPLRHGPYSSITERIRPSFENLLPAYLRDASTPRSIADWDESLREHLVAQAIRANIRNSVSNLRYGSNILEVLMETSGLLIVGAEYSLETGLVDFFDLSSHLS